ncbi:MAG: RNA-binding protein [Oscillospiraceae bacterium]|nr:RNA-binding protein [Oscillospiraceae bacterium]
MSDEQRLLIARIEDLYTARQRGRRSFTSFLSEGEYALARSWCERRGEQLCFWGGYDGAQRVMAGGFPDYEEPDTGAFPIRRLFIGGRMTEGLTHRDYLGSMLGLGIERAMCGDIIVTDSGAYAMLAPTSAELVLRELTKVGRTGVKVRECDADEDIERKDDIAYRSATISSLRLDCLVSAMTDLSREKSSSLIRSGAVSVDHFPCEDVSRQVPEGSLISIRGHGRYVLSEVGGRTKKDRIHITFGKYQ